MCMNPLDLIKTRFQVNRGGFSPHPAERSAFYQRVHGNWRYYALGGKPGVDIIDALREIVERDGWRGLYRGLVPNIVGNSSSWGLYFLWYTMAKQWMAQAPHEGAEPVRLTAGQYLAAATGSGGVTAVMTNPIWVVKTRMFTTSAEHHAAARPRAPGAAGTLGAWAHPGLAGTPGTSGVPGGDTPQAYRGLWDGLVSTVRSEGFGGLYKGVGLAVLGVSNGAIQFMAYEKLKQWRCSAALRRQQVPGPYSEEQLEATHLTNTEYTVLSGVAKFFAICITYPYQVVRSRVQNHATSHIYPNTWTCIVRTYREEGITAFYRGMAPNAVRILPGTCVTFVAYENVTWALRRAAKRRAQTRGARGVVTE